MEFKVWWVFKSNTNWDFGSKKFGRKSGVKSIKIFGRFLRIKKN